ncbi:hypothetical protein R1flu_014111 [Riccia fluitans]|uniref:Uncharacterized protein n=1 Tax=Riccia fluitans TaxID=41844 RepID=A0ABD1YFW1_9MARC
MALGSGGGGRDRRRRGKSPELPEEGEFMPEVPAPPPKKARPWAISDPRGEDCPRYRERGDATCLVRMVCLPGQLGRVQTSILDSRYGRREGTFGW